MKKIIYFLTSLVMALVLSYVAGDMRIFPILLIGGAIASFSYRNRADMRGVAFLTCANIAGGVTLSCSDIITAGVANDVIYLYNVADQDTFTPNVTNGEIIEDLALASGKFAYAFEGKNNSITVKQTLVKKKFSEGFDHQIDFIVFLSNPVIKALLEQIVKGKVRAIVPNNYKGATGNAAFEIFGWDIGLECTALTRDSSDVESQGAYKLTLKTNPDTLEGHLAKTFFLTDYATTKALVEDLLP